MPRHSSALLLIDISNSFTKFAVSRNGKIGRVSRIPTKELRVRAFADAVGNAAFDRAVLASVVPSKSTVVRRAVKTPILEVSPSISLGVAIDYPQPGTIGADRLANAAACVALYGAPSIVVDFGTAVTFDIISPDRTYIGGVIAPGLGAMTEYLHTHTALLPRIELAEPPRAVGKTTRDAMLAGAIHGYRGLVAEIVQQIRKEAFPRSRPKIIATGGDAKLISQGVPLFHAVAPNLTLEGLRLIGELNPCPPKR